MTSHLIELKQQPNDAQINLEESQDFEALLDYLWEKHNFDFGCYKRPSLMRQIQRRMEGIAIAHYSDYIHYLKANPAEFSILFKNFSVKYTRFFRDALVWDYIAAETLPRLLAQKAVGEPIKIWSAGCASGEETYTLAILLAEALGEEQFKQRVKIYGTDISSDAIYKARQGCYSRDQVAGIPPALLSRYFEQDGEGESYCFRKDLRRSLLFVRHNLLQDGPLSHIDLLVCRNALIYFTTEGQIRALMRFHFGLDENGFLLLGSTEMLIFPTEKLERPLFTPIHLQYRVFQKEPKSYSSDLLIEAFRRRKIVEANP